MGFQYSNVKIWISVTFCDFQSCNSDFSVTSFCKLWFKASPSYKLIRVILEVLDSNLLVLCKGMDDGKVSLHRQGQGGPYGANLESLNVWKFESLKVISPRKGQDGPYGANVGFEALTNDLYSLRIIVSADFMHFPDLSWMSITSPVHWLHSKSEPIQNFGAVRSLRGGEGSELNFYLQWTLKNLQINFNRIRSARAGPAWWGWARMSFNSYYIGDLGKTSDPTTNVVHLFQFSVVLIHIERVTFFIFVFPQLSDIWYFHMLYRVFFEMYISCLRLGLTSSSFNRCTWVHSLVFL